MTGTSERFPSARAGAARRTGCATAGHPRRRTVRRGPTGRTAAPLSFAQERLWFMEQFAPGTRRVHVPVPLRLRGALDVGRAARARWPRSSARHEALRSRFPATRDGRPTVRHRRGGRRCR